MPHPVGSKKPNSLGLCDMLGNVAEACHDFYDTDYYSISPELDPRCPKDLSFCTGAYNQRGGYYSCARNSCRERSRSFTSYGARGDGFRIVVNVFR
ncbi:MAG: SUMF1/EgtB/PvdO family nonheme iron enzyme [Planctomycetota bacterium]